MEYTYKAFGEEELTYLREVIESQELWRGTSGNFVARLEDAFADDTGRKYVHAVASGTAANEAALAAVGVGPGDEVIVTPCSFIASSIAPLSLGAIPVFADVDPQSLHITAEGIEAVATEKSKAVVVVHLSGQPADMDPILAVCRKRGLKLVEDCAQAYGVYYHGKMAGTLGDATCYSMQQSKHVTAGEGGLVTTDDPEGYKRAVLYANCGMPWYRYGLEGEKSEPVGDILRRGHFAMGHNYRMTELQGAVAVAQLEKLPGLNARRAEMAAIIEEELAGVEGILLAKRLPDTVPNYWTYPLFAEKWTTGELSAIAERKTGGGVPRYAEVNYLEEVYQRMNAERRTSVGTPLPDYVRYELGICPNAEYGAQRFMPMMTHPVLTNVDDLRATVRRIKEAAEG